MKLYFYFMEVPYRGEPYIRFEECEVIEKPKTYYPKEKFPSGFYVSSVRKSEIGRVNGYIQKTVILTEKNTNLALDLIANDVKAEIFKAEHDMRVSERKLKAIEKFREESEE